MTVNIRETPPDSDRKRIIERPDGFYWQSVEGNREHGPFASLQEAIEDMTYAEADSDIGENETLDEAESEIGIADWIDPETGEPAEGYIPHIEDQ